MIDGHFFKDKRILITGASSGIGAALASKLSDLGATVFLAGRDISRLQELRDRCAGRTEVLVGDLTSENTISALHTFVVANGLDIAILNAGTCDYDKPGEFDAHLFHRIIRENLLTMTDSISAVLPALKASNGQLVLMSSIAAYGGFRLAPAYCASKAAIRVLAQSLDLEFRDRGVCVTCVCPGFVNTPLTQRNPFNMPFLIGVDEAVENILRGVRQKKHEIHFPFRFSLFLKLIMSLPASWQYRLTRKMTDAGK